MADRAALGGCGILNSAMHHLQHLRYPIVLLDLDGTLVDSAPGILRSLTYALERLAVPIPDQATLYSWLGPPLSETLTRYLGNAATAEQAIRLYREYYLPTGIYECSLFPGIAALLAELHAAGATLALATSKPQVYARQIIEHFSLQHYFTYLGGATLDRRINTKAQVIGDVLAQLGNPDPAQCVMVGDRQHDVLGAREYGLPVIAVRHGYAPAGELEACQLTAIVAHTAELRARLLPATPEIP